MIQPINVTMKVSCWMIIDYKRRALSRYFNCEDMMVNWKHILNIAVLGALIDAEVGYDMHNL